MRDDHNCIEVYTEGKKAFDEIIRCIDAAENSICINMFIWRDDEIGRTVAEHILAAADRGVSVEIIKDKYGAVLEYAEESQRSLLHESISVADKASVLFLELLYNPELLGKEKYSEESELGSRIKAHKNIMIRCDERRYDHSKYYIFDDQTMILGGMNIEDKEVTRDRKGRQYKDYMIKLSGKDYVDAFRKKTIGSTGELHDSFVINQFSPYKLQEEKQNYLSIIKNAEQYLYIVMAYFSPIGEFMRDVIDAAKRGVKINIIIPETANFMDDLNKGTIKKLFKAAQNAGTSVNFFLAPYMVHAKLIMSEKTINLGSCNITRKSFKGLGELNFELDNNSGDAALCLKSSVEELISLSHMVDDKEKLTNRQLIYAIERSFM